VLGGNGTIDTIKDAPDTALNDSRVLTFKYSVTSGDDDDCFFEVGDSGSPVFVNQNGVAAIVGTNSLVATLDSGDILNLSNFIPTYVDELNTIMENSGYRMTKAIPGTTNLSLTHTPPTSIIRAGHSLTLQLTLENTGQTAPGAPPYLTTIQHPYLLLSFLRIRAYKIIPSATPLIKVRLYHKHLALMLLIHFLAHLETLSTLAHQEMTTKTAYLTY